MIIGEMYLKYNFAGNVGKYIIWGKYRNNSSIGQDIYFILLLQSENMDKNIY